MMRPLLLLSAVLGLIHGASPPSCPDLPVRCTCKISKEIMRISCDGVSISRLVQSLGTQTVDELRIRGCNEPTIESLPFNGLRLLEVSNCSVANIKPTAWKRIEKTLQILVLSGNQLTSVPTFTPSNMTALSAIDLSANQIWKVDEKAFAATQSLTQLRLKKNNISDIPPKTIDVLKSSLILLDLSGNQLQSIPAQILRNAGSLMYLDLSSNNISEINNFELMNLVRLRELRLQNNTLRHVHPMAFMNVPELQYLYLQDNLIGSLDGDRLQAFKKLELLDASNNFLAVLPKTRDLPNLNQIKLDGNLISQVDTLAFSNNPKLQLISLQNNNIAQISKNSFDQLDQLVVLLLANNSITKIEKGMLDGIRNLQQLNLRNNSLESIEAVSFASLPLLTNIDVAHNQIWEIEPQTFAHQKNLFWLDLSNNNISTFREHVFTRKIANIILDGNPLECDDKFDEVLNYLITNQVRTFLPFQPEIKCSGPEKYAGTRLKDLMMKKANETLSKGSQLIGLTDNSGAHRSIISSFIPNMPNLGDPSGLPILRTITDAIPALRSIPGLGGSAPTGRGARPVGDPDLNQAIEQFTSPLVRFATGGEPVASDISQLIRSIPNFVVNVPGFGDMDMSKMDPSVVEYVLNGGQIPGIEKATMDKIIKTAMQRVHQAAAANMAGTPLPDESKRIPPLDRLPSKLVTQIMQGESLPGLDQDQTRTVMEFYTQKMPTMDNQPVMGPINESNDVDPKNATSVGAAAVSSSATAGKSPMSVFSPQLFDMLKLLPPGYNISKIPMEVINSVTKGEVPDMRLLPADLLEHFKNHATQLSKLVSGAAEDWLSDVQSSFTPHRQTLADMLSDATEKLVNNVVQELEESFEAAKTDIRSKLDPFGVVRKDTKKMVSHKNVTIDEILEKLPTFARPELSTFSPYDINELSSEMILEKEQEEKHRKIRIYTAIALAFISAVTIIVLLFFVRYIRNQRKTQAGLMCAASNGSPVPPPVPPTPRRPLPVNMLSETIKGNGPGLPQFSSTLIETPARR